MAVLLNVDFSEILTPKCCSILVTQLIKYIAYNTQQIPFTYDGVKKLMNRKQIQNNHTENHQQLNASLRVRKAIRLYKEIETQFNYFENTFNSIEEELSNCLGLKEILIVLGTTLVSPKHVFRIRIPQLNYGKTHAESVTRRHLCNLYRCILKDYHNIFSKNIGPTNTFILLRMDTQIKPKSNWFIPKHNFNISSKVNSVIISFNSPTNIEFIEEKNENRFCGLCCDEDTNFSSGTTTNCNLAQTQKDLKKCNNKSCIRSFSYVLVDDGDISTWYQTKEILKGFKDFKVDGVSVFSVMSNLD